MWVIKEEKMRGMQINKKAAERRKRKRATERTGK
jgi:hypothetical protein